MTTALAPTTPLAPDIAAGYWTAASFRSSGVPPKFRHSSLDGYLGLLPDAQQPAGELLVNQLLAWTRRGQGRWLYLHGPAGTGKTSLAVALACVLIGQHGRQPAFRTSAQLLDEGRAEVGIGGGQSAYFAALAAVDVLLMDDLGREDPTPWAVERLGLLIGQRYDQERLTICTSNLGLDRLGKHLGGQTAWRLAELSETHEIAGPNLRAILAARAKAVVRP